MKRLLMKNKLKLNIMMIANWMAAKQNKLIALESFKAILSDLRHIIGH